MPPSVRPCVRTYRGPQKVVIPLRLSDIAENHYCKNAGLGDDPTKKHSKVIGKLLTYQPLPFNLLGNFLKCQHLQAKMVGKCMKT